MRSLNVVEGTTITGLYATHVSLASGQNVAGKDTDYISTLNAV